MPEKLEIRRGGKLFAIYWVYDKAAKKGEFVPQEVTGHAIRFLFERCELEAGVTLRDILLLLNTDITVFNVVLGNHCRELVAEGLKPCDEKITDMECLELYWHLIATGELSGHIFPSFHGVGLPDSEGNRIYYAVEMTAVNKMVDLPLRLNPAFRVFEQDTDKQKDGKTEEFEFANPEYSLGHILHGILWELSFLGAPESRDNFVAEINRRVEEITKPVDVDDVIKEEPDTNIPPGQV